MAVSYFPFNSIVVDGVADRPANAENLAAYLAAYFSNGVLMQTDAALQVVVSSGMNIQIKAGSGCINGKTILNTAAETLSVEAASATLDRIDRVIFRLDESNRLMEFDVLKGTPSSSPSAPELTRSEGIYEMCLAEIRIPAGASSIIASYITDTRANLSLCGYAKTSTFEGVTINKLWENASITSSFPPQDLDSTVLADLPKNYDFIIIVFSMINAETYSKAVIAPVYASKNSAFMQDVLYGAGGKILGRYRGGVISPEKITFKNGYSTTPSTDGADDTCAIPKEIYGIKGVA